MPPADRIRLVGWEHHNMITMFIKILPNVSFRFNSSNFGQSKDFFEDCGSNITKRRRYFYGKKFEHITNSISIIIYINLKLTMVIFHKHLPFQTFTENETTESA
ncbi:hypothetical protein RF11_00880 [Thelohanellus kitauei]|uniref:Uncharacterized protein n=1 Tax=Thelohanellus kitauei TaxID=669202 RepID=A0A0C2MWX2_THEKT|nr:hypothetical protein RF11_00880 [Thelohanellus kitauei]